MYETSIPQTIRHQGESAVLHFKNREAIQPPDFPCSIGLIWPRAQTTFSWRMPRRTSPEVVGNMTASETSAVRSVYRRSAIGATAKSAAKGGLVAAVIEAPVAGMENFFHWKRGRKSGEDGSNGCSKEHSWCRCRWHWCYSWDSGSRKGCSLGRDFPDPRTCRNSARCRWRCIDSWLYRLSGNQSRQTRYTA